jgi:hypothetical protein
VTLSLGFPGTGIGAQSAIRKVLLDNAVKHEPNPGNHVCSNGAVSSGWKVQVGVSGCSRSSVTVGLDAVWLEEVWIVLQLLLDLVDR